MIQTFHRFAINAGSDRRNKNHLLSTYRHRSIRDGSFLFYLFIFLFLWEYLGEQLNGIVLICLIAGCPDHGRRGGPTLFAMRGFVFRILTAHVEVRSKFLFHPSLNAS